MSNRVERAKALRRMLQRSGQELPDEALAEVGVAGVDVWQPNTDYASGQVVAQGDRMYRILQAHRSQAHQPPGSAGMLAVYAPIQRDPAPGQVLPWVYGEAGLAVGDQREHGGVAYEAIQSPGANIWEPSTAPSVWRAKTT